jgi:DNA-binding MarR family transcriptional regulator
MPAAGEVALGGRSMTIFDDIRDILSQADLSTGAKIVLIFLQDKQGDNGYSWPSLTAIERGCGLSRPSIVRAIKELTLKGKLSVKRPGKPSVGNTNHYSLSGNDSKPVKNLNQLRSDTGTSKDSLPELVKNLYPNIPLTDHKQTKLFKKRFGEFVLLTDQEYQKLIEKFGQEAADKKIEALNNGIGAKGYRYKSHYHAILNWDSRNNGRKSKLPRITKEVKNDGKYETISV